MERERNLKDRNRERVKKLRYGDDLNKGEEERGKELRVEERKREGKRKIERTNAIEREKDRD